MSRCTRIEQTISFDFGSDNVNICMPVIIIEELWMNDPLHMTLYYNNIKF